MVILCDFDDTTAEQNIASMILERFSSDPTTESEKPDWRKLRERVVEGLLPLWKYQELAFSALNEGRGELGRFAAKEGRLRSGFVELAAFCAQNNLSLAVISHGLDFYVNALLSENNLGHLPQYTVDTTVENGILRYTYAFTRSDCVSWGNCKCRVLQRYQELGHKVVYVGDGLSDTCPAAKADFVFALGRLTEFCSQNAIPHTKLNDFFDVIHYIQKNAGNDRSLTRPLERLNFD